MPVQTIASDQCFRSGNARHCHNRRHGTNGSLTAQVEHDENQTRRRRNDDGSEQRQTEAEHGSRAPQIHPQFGVELRALRCIDQAGAGPVANLFPQADPLFLGRGVDPHASLPNRRESTTRPTITTPADTRR